MNHFHYYLCRQLGDGMEIIVKYYIFSGRFQPFHNGHMQILKNLLRIVKKDDVIVLAISTQAFSVTKKSSEFTNITNEHYQEERNPWNYLVVLEAVNTIIQHLNLNNRILSTLIPRPDLGLEQIKLWFPSNRVWIIPKGDENFDDLKEKFFLSQGEEVLRINDISKISGWELRKFYYVNDVYSFNKFIPECLKNIYHKD